MAKAKIEAIRITESKLNELETKITMLQAYKDVRMQIVDSMQWQSMERNEPDNEHEEYYFTEPAIDDTWKRPKYEMYLKVIEILDKEFIK